MKSLLYTTLYYYSNFPPANFSKLSRYGTPLPIKSSSKILSKNYIILILFLKFLSAKHPKNKPTAFSTRFLIKPHKSNIANFLRAPYKNKLSRNQLYTPIYRFSIQIRVHTTHTPLLSNPSYYVMLTKYLCSHFNFFESNITYLSKIRFNVHADMRNYWNYKQLSIMHHKYFLPSFAYLFFLKKIKNRYFLKTGKLLKVLSNNYKILREPITLCIRIFVAGCLPTALIIHDQKKINNLMLFIMELAEICDYSIFKSIF